MLTVFLSTTITGFFVLPAFDDIVNASATPFVSLTTYAVSTLFIDEILFATANETSFEFEPKILSIFAPVIDFTLSETALEIKFLSPMIITLLGLSLDSSVATEESSELAPVINIGAFSDVARGVATIPIIVFLLFTITTVSAADQPF